jgi:hypothetical protein
VTCGATRAVVTRRAVTAGRARATAQGVLLTSTNRTTTQTAARVKLNGAT